MRRINCCSKGIFALAFGLILTLCSTDLIPFNLNEAAQNCSGSCSAHLQPVTNVGSFSEEDDDKEPFPQYNFPFQPYIVLSLLYVVPFVILLAYDQRTKLILTTRLRF